MNWVFFAEPMTLSNPALKWRPTGVSLNKKLVAEDGSEIARSITTLEEVIQIAEHEVFAEEYLSIVRSHFDAQYDKIYSSVDYLNSSIATTFGHELSICISVYRALKDGHIDG